jgi:hypothetical protein
VVHTGDDTKVERLFYETVLSLVMGQRALKHVDDDVFYRFCDCDEFCLFVGLHCGDNFSILKVNYKTDCP